MDLHSYAKRRSAKKWTIEHKRKLVDARISYDNMFANHPAMSLVPWRKFINLAKLDGYNVLFVRKQWFSLVAKYKQQKQSRLGNLPSKSMDSELLKRMSEEWEFFAPIHTFMTHKTTDLHSYALKEPNQAEAASRRAYKTLATAAAAVTVLQTSSSDSTLSTLAKIEPTKHMNDCSSDTNDAAMGIRNDHDFYSKKSSFYQHYQQHNGDDNHLHHHHHHHHHQAATACDIVWPMISSYFADGSEDADTKDSMAKLLLEPKFEDFLHDDETAVELQLPAYVREEVAETTMRTNDDEKQQQQQQQLPQQQQHQQQQSPNRFVQLQQQQQHQQQKQQATSKPKLTTAATAATTTTIGKRSSRRTKRNIKCCGSSFGPSTTQQTQPPLLRPAAPASRAPPTAMLGCSMQNERDAYYRHKRRYNHRQERRFDALLAVFGKIVKTEYPNIDVQQLSAMAGVASASSEEEA